MDSDKMNNPIHQRESFSQQSTLYNNQQQPKCLQNRPSVGKNVRYTDTAPSYIGTSQAYHDFMDQTANNNLDDMENVIGFNKKLNYSRFCWANKGRVRWPTILIYTLVFTMGVAIGFTPFIKVYIDTCQEDREVLQFVVDYFKHRNNTLAEGKGLFEMRTKKGHGIGNGDIELQCDGPIDILKVEHWPSSDIGASEAATDTLKKMTKYCQKNLQTARNINRCLVSLKRIYGGRPYPANSVTVIEYSCKN